MKKLAHVMVAIVLPLFFISCKKDISGDAANNSKANSIVEFLKKRKQDKRPIANAFVENIIKNLQFGISYSEEYRNGENFIIVPLKNQYFSQHILGNDKPMQFLLVTENQLGKIRRMDIVLYYPTSNTLKKLPPGFFTTFFEENISDVDGKIQLINLKDSKQYETMFENRKMKYFKKLQRLNIEDRDERQSQDRNGCTTWYLVTTWYDSQGNIVDREWQEIGTWCEGDCCPPNEICDNICDDTSGGGGGGAVEIGETKTVNVTVTDGRIGGNGYMNFTSTAHFTLTGLSFQNQYLNCFNSGNGTGTFTTWPSGMHLPTTPWELQTGTTWQGVNITNNSMTAVCSFSIPIIFPNNPSQSIPNFGNSNTFQASIVLH